MCAPNRLRAGFRQPEMLHLAGLDQIPDGTGNNFDRHLRIDAVLVKQVDHVGLQALERRFSDLLDVFRPAVQAQLLARRRVDAETNFVAITTRLRTGPSASPTRSSLVNGP